MYTKVKSRRSIGRIGNAFVILALLLTSVLASRPGTVRAEGEIVEWTSTNTEGSLDADFVAANVDDVPLSRTGVLYNTGTTYNSTDWETSGTINLGKYLEWGLTPASGYEIDLTDFDIRYDRSNSGPSMLAIYVSTDDFATVNVLVHTDDDVNASGEEQASIDLSGVPTVEDGQTALFRLYAYNASSSGGTFDIENVVAWNGKGIRIRGDVTPAGEDYVDLALSKTADPVADVTTGGLVTYTVTLANSGTISDTNVLLTDALPSEVDFAYWIEEPAGASVSADQLTWNGAVESGAGITFTFAVTNLAGINTTVVNTAEFSGTTQADSSDATYTTLIGMPYTQDFGTCPPAGWLVYSVASNRDWSCGYGNMSVNGYGGDVASDDWLISPVFDFEQTDLETLTFETWTRYTDGGEPWPQISVMYSTDYSGSGDPNAATWTELTDAIFSPEDSQLWTSSGEVDVSGISGTEVYFAFRYLSSGTGSSSSSEWRMDNFELYERPPLSIAKTATPTFLFQGDLVTYTIVLGNEGATSEPGVILTDTLPGEVDFAHWIEQPAGAAESAGQITWTGAVAGGAQITFTFAVTNMVDSGTVVNTAEFSSMEQTGTAEASFAVVEIVEIHDIQGDGLASPLLGELHTIEGIVVGDFQPSADYIRGFFVQEEDADADDNPLTSEGIFVYYNAVDVNVGDLVRVSGTVEESYDLTRLGDVTGVSIVSSNNPLPTVVEISPPFSETTYLERYEGMLVSVPETLYVTEIYYLGRGGQLLLSPDARLMNPTQVITPGQPAIDLQAANNLNRIILDDGSLRQNPDPVIYPSPFLSATNTVRGGDTVDDIVGVLSYSYSGWSGSDAYRIQPIEPPTITPANPRPTSPPDVGGTLHIASFNVLNYFDTFSDCTAGVGGETTDCRGANSAEEFTRQRDKIIAAMVMLDADVIGLMEIENDGYADEASAIDDLVDGLNAIAGAGTYAYVDADAQTGVTNVLGTDAIKVGLIYKPATVIMTGTTAVLDSSVDPTFIDTLNRPALAQSFEDATTGEIVTVIVNHLKSKGSACTGDPDTGDGQGECNLTRTAAAEALVNWLNGDPTDVGRDHHLIIGDLNSYAKEDPILALEEGGYTNLMAMMAGDAADEVYGYVFDGQWGTLDYAMASSGLLPYVTGAEGWPINADEPIALDYNVEYKTPGQIISFYNDDPYRASDHDPVVVGLDLPPICIPVAEASIDGPLNISGTMYINGLYAFAAITSPTNATGPITYTWEPEPTMGQGTGLVHYLWTTAGPRTITLTVENCGMALTVVRTYVVETPPVSCPLPLTGAAIEGPLDVSGTLYIDGLYSFAAIITPTDATLPITYTWEPEPATGQGTPLARYSWATPGPHVITLTVENCGGAVTAVRTIIVETPSPVCPLPLTGASISGPVQGDTDTAYTFSAIITPTNATSPVTYTWDPAPDVGQGTSVVSYTWTMPGMRTITLTVENCGAKITARHSITISETRYYLYLPLVMRNTP